jgi:AraC-like DNA-binding protein
MLRRLFPTDWNSAFHLSIQGQVFAIAERMLKDIFDDTGELSDKVAATVVESALLVLSDAIKSRRTTAEPRRTQTEIRIQEVLKFIDVHLSNSELSIAMVARVCGISERYLFSLLREHGTPFRQLVWDRRLKAAKHWLSSTKATETMVSEVAYRSGFKSPAHFSRAFKRAFAMNPCECRVAESAAPRNPRHAQSFTVPRGLE